MHLKYRPRGGARARARGGAGPLAARFVHEDRESRRNSTTSPSDLSWARRAACSYVAYSLSRHESGLHPPSVAGQDISAVVRLSMARAGGIPPRVAHDPNTGVLRPNRVKRLLKAGGTAFIAAGELNWTGDRYTTHTHTHARAVYLPLSLARAVVSVSVMSLSHKLLSPYNTPCALSIDALGPSNFDGVWLEGEHTHTHTHTHTLSLSLSLSLCERGSRRTRVNHTRTSLPE
eukprot:COSAG03_NODE_1149_length_4704_cov_54.385451_5_plen_232_part_00